MTVNRGECMVPLLRILVFPGSYFDTNPSICDWAIRVYS